LVEFNATGPLKKRTPKILAPGASSKFAEVANGNSGVAAGTGVPEPTVTALPTSVDEVVSAPDQIVLPAAPRYITPTFISPS